MSLSPAPNSDQHRPVSSQTVSVSWGEDASSDGRRQFQIELSECVETKTITTTTTTKRTFPPIFVGESRRLETLDAKEYPLAAKPTPPELAKFSFEMPPPLDNLWVARTPSKAPRLVTDGLTSASESSNLPPQRKLSNSTPDPYSLRSRRFSPSPVSPAAPNFGPAATQQPRPTRSSKIVGASSRLRRSLAQSSRRGEPSSSRPFLDVLTTPDSSTIAEGGSRDRQSRFLSLERSRSLLDAGTSEPSTSFDSIESDSNDSQTVFSGSVSTPPITDADPDLSAVSADDSPHPSIRSPQQSRPASEAATVPSTIPVSAQDASLPSPRLSPTLAATQLPQHPVPSSAEPGETLRMTDGSNSTLAWPDASQVSYTDGALTPPRGTRALDASYPSDNGSSYQPYNLHPQAMLEAFDAMPADMKTLMLYQFLRRCPRKTLRVVADVVNPSLQCDFLRQLPLELSYHVLSYLDHRDLCRAAQVSKHWRHLIDCNETGWKELFDRDGFRLPPGELEKAIRQGWGWQDPEGHEGCEVDLSAQKRLNSTEAELTRAVTKSEPQHRLRSSKRKRALTNFSAAERSKRRASAQEAAKDDGSAHNEPRQHKSEGPLSASNAAATAVPDPQIGLPSLRRLHLFKSLYRRHYMIRQSWTSGKVQPSHVAFTAHPRHVITCLQFDEDKIITGSDDTLIHIYDTKTGQLRKKLDGHEGGVWALQYEGNTLVSGSTDRSVRVWDIEKELCTQVFYGHTSTVRCLQILMPTEVGKDQNRRPMMQPAKPLIITGSRDSQLRVWRLPEPGSRRYIQTGPPANDADCPYFIRTLIGHTHSVRAISAHGDTLVSGSYDHTVRVWRISTGESLHVLHGHSQKVYSVVLDHERNRCISGAMDSLVKIWDLATGSCLHTLEGHSLLVGLLDLRDERLVSAAADSTLRIWDPESGKCRNVLTAHTGAITCFQHDGRKVISGSEKTVKMWDIASGNCIQDLLTDLSGVWQVKFDDRRCIAAVQRDQLTYIEILDFGAIRDGKPPEELGQRILLNEPEVQRLLEEDV